MKQRIFTLLSLLLLAVVCATSAFAEDFSAVYRGKTIYYNILTGVEGNQVAVTHQGEYSFTQIEYTGEVWIPEKVTHENITYTVTKIDPASFFECDGLTKVVIPKTVESIGANAFAATSDLSTICNCSSSLNFNLDNMKDWGIYYIIEPVGDAPMKRSPRRIEHGYTDVTISACPYKVTGESFYENGIHYEVTAVNDDFTSNTVKVIKKGNDECYSGNIVIPATVAYGDLGVVYNVTEIDANAFSGCTGITSIKDNSGILTQTQIDAIVGGHSTEPSVGETFTEDGFTYRVKTITPSYTAEVITGRCPQTSSAVTIPSEVTCTQDGHSGTFTVVGIAAGAFKDCKTLSGIEIPNSVTEIADDAFEGCSGLNTVTDNTTEHILGDDISDWTADNNGVGGKFTVDGIEYEITNNTATPKTVKIVNACPATYSVVTLPNTVEHNGKTYSVTDIDGHAFDGCMNVEDIVDNSNDLLTDEQEQNVENGTGISGNGANTVSGLTIYHSGQGAVTSFAGGKVEGEIAYKRKITPNRWETICFPFNVEEIKMTRVGSSTEESIWPVYNNGGETKPGHFWMRTFDAQDAQVSAEQFQNNWQNITGTDKPLIEKNKPYIIQVPSTDKNGGVFNFADTYITFYGRLDANEMIPARIADADIHTVSTDGQFSYNANTTMMPQTVSNAYVMDNAGVSFVVGTEVKPFECYVLTNGATIQRIRSIGLNTPGYEETTGLIGADEVSPLVLWSDGGELFISSDHSQRLQVYSIDGRCVATVDVTGDVTANVTLNAGCYIVIGDGVRGKVVVK